MTKRQLLPKLTTYTQCLSCVTSYQSSVKLREVYLLKFRSSGNFFALSDWPRVANWTYMLALTYIVMSSLMYLM